MSAIQHASALPAAARRAVTRSFSLLRSYPLLLAGITLLGFGLRLPLLDRFPLREDEAIYSYWALHFWQVDPFFLTVWPDKPPLYLWLQAGVLALLGPNQATARLLNIIASTLMIAVAAAIGRRFWGRRGGLLAALSLSLNPYAISFAATAFTDPLLVLAGSLAVLMALRGHSWWAGLWLGFAVMTKQQGVLYAPLVAALLFAVLRGASGGSHRRVAPFITRNLLTFLVGLGLVVGPLIYWDSLRWSVAPSPWDLGVRNYGALAAASVAEWPGRVAAWAPLVWHLTASWPVWVLLAGGLGGALLCANLTSIYESRLSTIYWRLRTVRRKACELRNRLIPVEPESFFSQNRTYDESSAQSSIPLIILGAWSVGFLVLHIVTTVQPWDRYLLPLAPLVALGIAGVIAPYARKVSGRSGALFALLLLLLLLPPAVQAAGGGLPIGGDHGAYEGLLPALAWLRQETPAGGVLYHRTLGWHYRFYLYDDLTAGSYELRWFSSAVYLADNAVKTPQRRKFWVEPVWAPLPELAHHLAVRGLHLHERGRFGTFVVFEIEEAERAYCTWCVCRLDRSGFANFELEGAGVLHP